MVQHHTNVMLDTAYMGSGLILADIFPHITALHENKEWIGLIIPHWIGWIAFVLALLYGSALSVHQETVVDKYIKHPKLKPVYSFGFGAFMTLFAIPMKYPHLDVFDLIIPAVILSTVGSQITYYLIAIISSTELWSEVKKRIILVVKGGNS